MFVDCGVFWMFFFCLETLPCRNNNNDDDDDDNNDDDNNNNNNDDDPKQTRNLPFTSTRNDDKCELFGFVFDWK